MTFSKKAEKIFNGGLFWNRGFSQIYVLAILLLLILAIPLTVRLTQQSQETRGRAASSACNSGFRSYDDNALRHPDITLNKIRQTVLASDGRTLWHRYGNWNGTDYDTWTAWSIQYGDLNQYGPSGSLSYNSFSELVQADGRIKQVLLQSDGKNLWYRYGNDYDGYTPWTNQYGNLDQYGPSGSLTYLSITEAVVSDGRLNKHFSNLMAKPYGTDTALGRVVLTIPIGQPGQLSMAILINMDLSEGYLMYLFQKMSNPMGE